MNNPLEYLYGYFHGEWRADFSSPLEVIEFIVENHKKETTIMIVNALGDLINSGVYDGYLYDNNVSCLSFKGERDDLAIIKELYQGFLDVLNKT